MTFPTPNGLTPGECDAFLRDGFVRLDDAFTPDLARQCRAELWAEIGLSPDRPQNWTRPVIRVAAMTSAPFVEAANTARLHAAYDRLAGPGGWLAPRSLGSFPIRFPVAEPPGDDGWHVDVSFGTEAPDFLDWRVNLASRGRALLMLFLMSDVGPDDAPTRIRAGSHCVIARSLRDAGEAGLTLRQLSADGYGSSAACEDTAATGPAGTVYLCHPFLVHAAQPHRGKAVKFMAQPPLMPSGPAPLESSLVAAATRAALAEG